MPRDGDGQRRWRELAVLSAIASGAATAEIAAAIGTGDGAMREGEVERLVTELERRGLVRAGILTAEGQRLMLTLVGEWIAATDALEAERRQVERLRTDLLSTISHELRTPLTLIRTSIGLLLDSEPDKEMRQRLLRNIKGSTDRMQVLVSDLLDLARMRGARLELRLRRVDLGQLVSGAVTLMRPLLDAKGQRVTVNVAAPVPVVLGDYRRLERVLLNLLSNAITFAPVESEIAVAVSADDREATIAVRDAGPGISAEALPHLFDQFFTERTSSSRHNIGAGLGLPIAQGIVEAHGGRIWVESDVGIGTTVSFTLPMPSPEERPA